MSQTLKNVKVGDRVWVSAAWGGGDKGAIKTIKRLTPSQIILEGGNDKYNRYQRGKPSKYNGHEPTYYGIGMASGRITGVATTTECARWDAEQEQKRLAAEEAQQKREADEAKEAELRALLPTKGGVDGPYKNTWGEWRVTFYATEDEVRRIAEQVRGILTEPPTPPEPEKREE